MNPRTRRARSIAPALACALLWTAAACAPAADLWVAADDPAVVTNNDCGQIAALSGRPLIHRSFHAGEDEGVPATIADRLGAGDELIAPDGADIEWITGANTVAVLGAGGRVRLDGLRVFADAEGKAIARLDVTLLAGELRVQVRLNERRPEALFASLGGAEFLVTRGDVELFAGGGDGWRAAALSGGASGRVRRGAMPGAPFDVGAGSLVGASGEALLGKDGAEAVRRRIPFSFESIRAALPPLPAMSAEMDAP